MVVNRQCVAVGIGLAGLASRRAVSRVVIRADIHAQPGRKLQEEEVHLSAVHGIGVRPEQRHLREDGGRVKAAEQAGAFVSACTLLWMARECARRVRVRRSRVCTRAPWHLKWNRGIICFLLVRNSRTSHFTSPPLRSICRKAASISLCANDIFIVPSGCGSRVYEGGVGG